MLWGATRKQSSTMMPMQTTISILETFTSTWRSTMKPTGTLTQPSKEKTETQNTIMAVDSAFKRKVNGSSRTQTLNLHLNKTSIREMRKLQELLSSSRLLFSIVVLLHLLCSISAWCIVEWELIGKPFSSLAKFQSLSLMTFLIISSEVWSTKTWVITSTPSKTFRLRERLILNILSPTSTWEPQN